MKKVFLPLFVALCLIVCTIPSVGMIFNPTTETIGNERTTELPALQNEDGSFNVKFITQLGDYFEKHFAFRPEAITADAKIQTGIFGVSNVDTVVSGKDGWLYYNSSVDDYLGRDTMTAREVNALVYNLGIIRDYAKQNGADFLFTIAPNKNSLYPGNMPYYYGLKVSDTHNRDLVRAALAQSDIPYCDLYPVFEEADGVKYFARDSHWNNEGALMAYNAIMAQTDKTYDDYSSANVNRKKDFVGDMSKMIFPADETGEYNSYYGAEDRYSYVTDTQSVEDGYIKTSCADTDGKLYMYRDSFGNALLPFFATAYGDATFSKAFTTDLSAELGAGDTDIFIMELVERNLDWLISDPPIFPASTVSGYDAEDVMDGEVQAQAATSMYTVNYTEISGTLTSPSLTDEGELYVAVTSGDTTVTYRAFNICKDGEDGGFCAYVPAGRFMDGEGLDISVIMKDKSGYKRLGSTKITVGEKIVND